MRPGTRALARMAQACLWACLAGCVPMRNAADRADIARIEAYLNGLPRFEAHFVQSGSDGAAAGLVWLDRPGHLRVDYEGPAARVMVITNGRINVLDRSNGALTTQPVSRTPLGLLLAPTIRLDGPVTVDSLVHATDQAGAPILRLTLSKTGLPGQGHLTLDFSDRPLRLRAVTVQDPYNHVLTLNLSGIDDQPQLTPELFQPPVAPAAD